MRVKGSIISGIFLSALFAAPTFAVSQEEKTQPPQSSTENTDLKLVDLVEATEADKGFFFFKDSPEITETINLTQKPVENSGWSISGDASFTPRSGSLLKGFGEANATSAPGLAGSFTPRNADAELILSYNRGDRDGDGKSKSLDIALSSSVSTIGTREGSGSFGLTETENFTLSSYDVGLSVGYSGFNLGASVKQDTQSYLNSIKGFDLGFGYRGNSWSTSLMVGEYSQRSSYLFGTYGNSEVNFYALEFGASYRLSSIFRLRGGVRYFDYNNRFGDDPFGLSVDNKQVFYLGTKVNF